MAPGSGVLLADFELQLIQAVGNPCPLIIVEVIALDQRLQMQHRFGEIAPAKSRLLPWIRRP